MEWKPEPSEAVLRLRPLQALARPLRDRAFLYERYEAFLERLADPRLEVVPLRDFASAPRERVVMGLRHDVDLRLDSALTFAQLEYRRRIRSTYFLLHTAPYYGVTRRGRAERRESLIGAALRLQELGHEVGLHYDLLTLQCVYGIDPRAYLAGELEWLRGHGIDVRGCAAHGSYWCHALGFLNTYFFAGLDEPVPGFPNTQAVEVDGRRCELAKGRLEEFELEYEANFLGQDHFFSDARFDGSGRRWHPDDLDLGGFRSGDAVIVLVHPCLWDRSLAAKTWGTLGRGVVRAAALVAQRGGLRQS